MDIAKLIVWIVIGLLALSFFGISLRALVDNPTNQDNMEFLVSSLEIGLDYITAWWNDFISTFSFPGFKK
ncbi:MAG: hypothetical protein WBK28_00120 [Minisyncoccia bacterium]